MTVFRILPVLLVLALLVPAGAFAQLQAAQWTESATAAADQQADGASGMDDSLPENVTASLTGASWSLDSDVTYGPPGPPSVTATANGSYTSGSLSFLGANGTSTIDFEIQVTQTAPPPVSVTMVPLTVHATGMVGVSGDEAFFPYANCAVTVLQNSTFVVNEMIFASLSGPVSDSFNVTNTQMVAPEVTVTGYIYAVANVGSEVVTAGTSGAATAFVDPTFEIADQTIPGTSSSYRDYFTVEYGDGFWALGNTPVENNTTWGRIKRMY